MVDKSEYQQKETKTEEYSEPDSDVEWVSMVSYGNWLGLSRWLKEQAYFEAWERSLLYDVGTRLKYGSEATPKQARQARRLLEKARELGFLEL